MPMPIKIFDTEISGVLEIECGRVGDERGYFSEIWSEPMFRTAGFEQTFVQDNVSRSKKATLRGLHYQLEPHGMGKLVRALTGAIFDAVVDLRRGSPTFGKWLGRELSAENHRALWVPVGFAHGFVSLVDETLVLYKCTAVHTPSAERSVHYADPAIGIEWPIEPDLVSGKDREAPLLEQAEHDFSFDG